MPKKTSSKPSKQVIGSHPVYRITSDDQNPISGSESPIDDFAGVDFDDLFAADPRQGNHDLTDFDMESLEADFSQEDGDISSAGQPLPTTSETVQKLDDLDEGLDQALEDALVDDEFASMAVVEFSGEGVFNRIVKGQRNALKDNLKEIPAEHRVSFWVLLERDADFVEFLFGKGLDIYTLYKSVEARSSVFSGMFGLHLDSKHYPLLNPDFFCDLLGHK